MSYRTSGASRRRNAILAGLFASTVITSSAIAQERTLAFDLPAEPLADALRDYGKAADRQLIFSPDLVRNRGAHALKGRYGADQALDLLLGESGLTWQRAPSGGIMIVRRTSPNPPDAAPAGQTGAVGAIPPTEVEGLLVTGTNIRGAQTTPSAVIRIDRDELVRRGVASIPELLATLPQNFASVGAIRPTSGAVEQLGNIGLATGVNLRGLGARATLTLIDGHRAAPTGVGTFFDSSAVPISAIERIEVVSDGASAIYGSDAVAGVVNYILRKPQDVVETNLRYGAAQGHYREYDASQVVGKTWGGGGAIAAVEYLKNDALKKTDRDFARNAISPADIIPESHVLSVSAHATQDLSARLALAASYLYSERHDETAELGGQLQDVDKDLNSATLSADVKLFGSWSADIATTFSRDRLVRRVTLASTNATTASRQRSDGTFAYVNLSGVLLNAPAGPVRAAFGAEYIKLTLLNLSPTRTLADAASRQTSLFGELLIPILGEGAGWARELTLSAAARHNDYDVWGSVTNPKLGLTWKPVAGLKARATWGTSFRTPGLNEISNFGMASFVSNQPDPTSPTGSSRTLNLTGSNTALKPEKSTNWTAGFDFDPAGVPGLGLSATYFNYRYTDRIDRAATTIPILLANQTLFSRFVVQNPTVEQIQALYAQSFSVTSAAGVPTTPSQITRITDSRLNNIASTHVDGVDFDVRYSAPAYGGVVRAGFGGSYYLTFKNQPVPGSATVPGAGITFTPSKFRSRANLGISRGPWDADLAVTYVGSYTDRVPAQPDRTAKAYAPLDLHLAYNVPDGGVLGGVGVALDVHNLFDKGPPFIRDTSSLGPYGFDPTNADPLGRVVSIVLRRRW
jgi:iron complex outermembrane receptor protein